MKPLLWALTFFAAYVSAYAIGDAAIAPRQAMSALNLTACRFWSHASVLVGDKIYIYGGEGRQAAKDGSRTTDLTLPRFFSLDIGQDFDTTNPSFKLLPAPNTGPPAVENATLWYDQVRNRIFLYGGAFLNNTGALDILPQVIWSFDLVQEQWSSPKTNGDSITRAASGSSAFIGDVAYYRGGQVDSYTTPDFPEPAGFQLLAGLRTFNMASLTFDGSNNTIDVFPYPISHGHRQGALVPIELSGRKYLINYGGGGRRGSALPLNTTYIYDVEDMRWYMQPTAGIIAPENTRGMCTAVAYAEDKTAVNIYHYGGSVWEKISATEGRFIPSRQMWILTIPAFQWIFVDKNDNLQPEGGLQDHTCHIQGSSMFVVGGRDFLAGCDRRPVKVFNISTLKWESTFKASSAPYKLPYEVSAPIGGNSTGGSPWDGKPFAQPSDENSPFFTLASYPNSTAPAPTTRTPKNRDGIIAGTTVGVISVVGIVLTIFFLRRRKNRRNRQGQGKEGNFHNEVFASIDPNTQPSTEPPTPISPDGTRRFWATLRRTPSSAMPNIPRSPLDRRRDELSVLDTAIGQPATILPTYGTAYRANTVLI
ncbi:hypothetical protein H072_4541 [Dactylellina haptotyla CBS 200.50]|uniref:Kelch repeat protein n=1 Tax=Dactylellina haptotyla (strain CBS 200.50) TaxID=1284197 RepID=S8AET1_DACHA|nr:hypothetical protein H072_4541 [Dactylellina haptotyla CBS 200.50]